MFLLSRLFVSVFLCPVDPTNTWSDTATTLCVHCACAPRWSLSISVISTMQDKSLSAVTIVQIGPCHTAVTPLEDQLATSVLSLESVCGRGGGGHSKKEEERVTR